MSLILRTQHSHEYLTARRLDEAPKKKSQNKKQNSENKENLKDMICRKLQLKLPVTHKIQAANITVMPIAT